MWDTLAEFDDFLKDLDHAILTDEEAERQAEIQMLIADQQADYIEQILIETSMCHSSDYPIPVDQQARLIEKGYILEEC